MIRPIQEDAPFDEDIPFDEIPRSTQQTQKIVDVSPLQGIVKIPSIMDDASESDGSVDSAEVLEDLNNLSKFMKERKQSSKGSNKNSRIKQSIGRISSLGGRNSSYSKNSSDW